MLLPSELQRCFSQHLEKPFRKGIILSGSLPMAAVPRATEGPPVLGVERGWRCSGSSIGPAERSRILGCHLPAPAPPADRLLHPGKTSSSFPFLPVFAGKNDGLRLSPAVCEAAGHTALSPGIGGCCKAACPCATRGFAQHPASPLLLPGPCGGSGAGQRRDGPWRMVLLWLR